ncbi:MAG: GNAT family N-acetyltransferase [Caulobacterales bacterium]|nr:GNAT family N-acetyltransferase [Caulobacterales bacterium]
MLVVSLTNTHYSHWLPLWRGYLEFYQEDLPQEITEITFKRLCDHAEKNMGGFIAFEGEKAFPKKCEAVFGQETRKKENRAIGLVHYVVHRCTWSDKDVCYLEDLYVDPNVRGGGVGRALINKVADFARENDLRHVYWQTNKANERSQILYEKMAGESEFIVYKLKL